MKKKHKSDTYTETKRIRIDSEELFIKPSKNFKAVKSKIVKERR